MTTIQKPTFLIFFYSYLYYFILSFRVRDQLNPLAGRTFNLGLNGPKCEGELGWAGAAQLSTELWFL